MPNYTLTATKAALTATGKSATFRIQQSDRHAVDRSRIREPIENAYTATLSDDLDLPWTSRAIMVATAGNVKITTATGDTVTLPALTAGVWHWIRARRIWSTGTAPTTIIVGY